MVQELGGHGPSLNLNSITDDPQTTVPEIGEQVGREIPVEVAVFVDKELMHSVDEDNPYAAPVGEMPFENPFDGPDAALRRQLIDCEANLRSVAHLLILGGVLLSVLIVLVAGLFPGLAADGRIAVILLLFLVLAPIQMATGVGLLHRRPWARSVAIVCSGLWLLVFPVGTILGVASLFYLMRPAATLVFDPRYQDVIGRTPEVEFRTSVFGWVLLMVIFAAGSGFVAWSAISR